jgi:hypothetical protein
MKAVITFQYQMTNGGGAPIAPLGPGEVRWVPGRAVQELREESIRNWSFVIGIWLRRELSRTVIPAIIREHVRE